MDTPRDASPYGLIQEELRDQPWRLLVACIMLNLTNIKQVRPIIWEFFRRYSTPEAAASADETELAELIRPLGLYNRRAKSIIRLSSAITRPWRDVDDLPGVGKYAADSFRIFVEGKMDVDPTDAKLRKYVEWARNRDRSSTQHCHGHRV
jgi:methyl-CpG-binding domain protein 4